MNPASKSSVFRHRVQQLRDGCHDRGLILPDGAAETILARHVEQIATTLRISERHALESYLTDQIIDQLVAACVQAKAERAVEVELSSPILLPIPHAARIIASLGMAVAAATTADEHSTATTAIREASDTLTNIALAITAAGQTGYALLEPATTVAARAELTRFADNLADHSWSIPDQHDGDHHQRSQRLRQAVLHDLQYLA